MYKILIVEDEPEIRKTVISYLSEEGYTCETVKNLAQAEEKILMYEYDCALVDLMLPDGNGMDLVEKIKTRYPEMGIIIVSAKGDTSDRVVGLDNGADDYLVKPFNLSELNARIKSLLRRRIFKGQKLAQFGVLKLNVDERRVFVKDEELILTGKEFDLLMYFISNQNKVLSKESIAEHVWGDYADQLDSLDFLYTHVKNLRRKMTAAGSPDYIQSVYGAGYKLADV